MRYRTFLFLFGALDDNRKCVSMVLCAYEVRSFAEVTDNFFFQPTTLEASKVSLEFARLGLPGYQRVCS